MIYQTSPYLHANRWSKFFHSWLSKLFRLNHNQKTLNLLDLYELLPQYESTKLTEQLEIHWLDNQTHHPNNPNLFRATIRTLGWKPLLFGLLLFPHMLLTISQPLLLTFLMDFFEPCSTMSNWYAWCLAIACILTTICANIIRHYYVYSVQTLGMRMRIAYNGLIYRKLLKLSSYSLNNYGSGQITNLLANDATQIESAITEFNYLWFAPIDVAIVTYLFWHFFKYITLIILVYTIFILLFNSVYGRLYEFLQTRMLRITDNRLKYIAELFKSMRIVKMYCWESALEKKIRDIRKQEIFYLIIRSIIDCIHAFLTSTYINLIFLLIFGTMWILNMRFDIRFFAVAYSLLSHTELVLMSWFTDAIRSAAKYTAAEKRIRTFLLLEESKRDRRLHSASDKDMLANEYKEVNGTIHQEEYIERMPIQRSAQVECILYKARWQEDGSYALRNIHFDAQPGDLICIIGPVGAGKSSLLQSLSGEIPFFDGKIRLRGSVCYVPQEPWIFSSTIKKNILFGKDYNPQLFRRIVRATALDTDFTQLSNGANTIVGDQGVMLSGGQKARVNMARALYRDADIYLLDDPLSAVDVNVSKHIFERSIKDYLSDRICILVTHQIQFIQDATRIIVLENGEMVETGTYEDLLSTSLSFRRLLRNFHQQEKEQQNEQLKVTSQNHMSSTSTLMEIDNDELISSSVVNIEQKKEGSVNWRVYISYLQAGGTLIYSSFFMLLIFGIREATAIFYGWWLAKWSDDAHHRYYQSNNCTYKGDDHINSIRSMNETEWKYYQQGRFNIYSGAGVALLSIVLIHIFLAKFMCLNASRILHNKMFRRLIRCPISFFDLNPIGRILNRFTKDMIIIDDELPWTLQCFIESVFKIFSIVVLVVWLNPWSLIPATLAGFGMLAIRRQYVPCSRDLRRLEGTTRSPIYSCLSSTIHGLKVIRSYRAEQNCLSEFFSLLDDNTRVSYLSLTMSRWAAIRFDWTALLFIALVTILAMIVRIIGQQFSAADITLTLSYSLNLMSIFQWTIRQSVELEIQMTSVERVLEYCQLDQESPAQVPPKFRPPYHWPLHGQITYNNVSMSHSKEPHASLALKQITLSIRPAEKIGIVGRTGAGKSSFIQTLFRMGTLTDGQIKIDDIDIATIGLDDLRRRISIIPQDPVLFTGTMRSNLDQFGDYSDVEIWHALEQVQLKKLVSEVMPHGLQSLVSESGSNLSVGQKQLVCLARAILKKNKILLIDEATANVDNETDELIQRSIREQFRECTVLTVAHRLRTVIDSDRIMVLGNGRLLEFDTPEALLSNKDSQFSIMVDQTSVTESKHLRLLANDARSNAQHMQETIIFNEESLEDICESDPFLTQN